MSSKKGLRPATNEEKGLRGKAAMKEIIKRARKGDEEWLEEHYQQSIIITSLHSGVTRNRRSK